MFHATQIGFFLSAATGEFGALRERLRRELTRPNSTAHSQGDFLRDGGTTLAKLEKYISHCDAVIHLIGRETGSFPAVADVEEVLSQAMNANIAERIPALKQSAGDFRFSYTQWEAYLAIYHRRPLYIYRWVGPGTVEPEPEQQEHFDRIRVQGRDRGTFRTEDELVLMVLRDLASLLALVDPLAEARLRPTVALGCGQRHDRLSDSVIRHLRQGEDQGHYTLGVTDRLIDPTSVEAWFQRAVEEGVHLAVLVIDSSLLAAEAFQCSRVRTAFEERVRLSQLLTVVAEPCDWASETRFASAMLFPENDASLNGLSEIEMNAILERLREVVRLLAIGSARMRTRTAPLVDERPRVSYEFLSGSHPIPGRISPFEDRHLQRSLITGAWEDRRVNLLYIQAPGGIGKTALLHKWLDESGSELRPYRGARSVFAYSFDANGADAGSFLRRAYEFFADATPAQTAEWTQLAASEKGKSLALYIRLNPGLLILDGFERMLGSIAEDSGTIENDGIRVLITALAADNPGLCILATRHRPRDLYDRRGATVIGIRLDSLAEADAAKLLFNLGVKGSESDRRLLARRVRGQCLSLHLLASYLVDRYGGNPQRAEEVRFFEDPDRAGSARTILKHYDEWLEHQKAPIRDVLLVIAVFDERFSRALFDQITEVRIPGLTDRLFGLPRHQLQELLVRLDRAGLIEYAGIGAANELIDCHPLIREYFREQLRDSSPAGWIRANGLLHAYFSKRVRGDAASEFDLEELYRACIHGCRAGLQTQVWREIFWPRIRRNRPGVIRNFNLRKYKAFDADLRVLRELAHEPWDAVEGGFTPVEQARIIMEVGCDLRAQGRLDDARAPLRSAYSLAEKSNSQDGAAEAAGNLSDLLGRSGDLVGAVEAGQWSVAHADGGGENRHRIISRGVLGNTLHLSGQFADAMRNFEEAEALQRISLEKHPFAIDSPAPPGGIRYSNLLGIEGFEYANLLLTLGEYDSVVERSRAALPVLDPSYFLAVALTELSLALGLFGQVKFHRSDALPEVQSRLVTASDGLLKAGRAEYMPWRFLAMGLFYRNDGDPNRALETLEEGLLFARLNQLRLAEIDLQLEIARTLAAQNNRAEAELRKASTKKLIYETGYRARIAEVENPGSK